MVWFPLLFLFISNKCRVCRVCRVKGKEFSNDDGIRPPSINESKTDPTPYTPYIPRYFLAISSLFLAIPSLFTRYSPLFPAIPPPLLAGHVHNFIPQNESMHHVHFMINHFPLIQKKLIWNLII